MPLFQNKKNTYQLARGVFTIKRGVSYLEVGNFDSALREFRRVAASKNPNTNRLVRSVAAFYAYNTERARKESKKARFGNSNLIKFSPVNSGLAWSDVDIAAVLIADQTPFMDLFLCAFLGRTHEAIRFQRRYVLGTPLLSWVAENGRYYTRYTQAQRVARELGLR